MRQRCTLDSATILRVEYLNNAIIDVKALTLRHIAKLWDALLRDSKGKPLERLVTTELRLDHRAFAITMHIDDRLSLALERLAEVSARLVTPRVGV